VIDTKGHENTEEETAAEQREKDHIAYIERSTLNLARANTAFTFILMVAGIVGVWLAIGSLNILKAQTKATQDSVAALVSSERAWVVIETHPPNLVPLSPGAIPPLNVFRFSLKNGGKTVARITKLTGESHLVEPSYTLPSPPPYMELPRPPQEPGFHQGAVLVPGDALETWIEINLRLNDAAIDEIRNSYKLLYVYGFLEYFDFSKEVRRLQFCYRYFNMGAS
jgi:hypothetical protein